MFTSVPVNMTDPLERLRHVHDVTKGAKEVQNALGAEMLEAWSELTPPAPFAGFMRLYSRSGLASRHRPPINVVISNVPGPRMPLYIAGARLDALYSVGPILEGIGLNITVWSYLDQMNFGLIACKDAMPDLWDLADGLHDALEELQKAVADAPA
jgi:diacylglycerol O-acyltransferase